MAQIEEFEVREVGGVRARMGSSVGSVVLTEGDHEIGISLPATFNANLSIHQARKLARHLNRFAKRVEDRNNA